MIRNLKLEDINEANKLLSNLNYNISLESFNNTFFRALVYYENGIKGILVYDLIYDRIEIEYIIVDKKYRKNGIGRSLLSELDKENVKNITLEVNVNNKTAINFYINNGFKIVSVRKNYYDCNDGYLMLKELGE